MNHAVIDFRHYRVTFTDDVLRRLGSRYFARKEAGKQLREWLLGQAPRPAYQSTLNFSQSQLVCANEVFAEAALADPIADLEVWDEWRTGCRRFPYPGVYTRLQILQQERKTSATSSVGVLGEIFAGLFSQAFVSPLVVVRPIRRWPDFIFLGMDQRYSFVESKASASLDDPRRPGLENVSEDLLVDGLADAVQELNAEPLIRVWLVFTDVSAVQPMQASVCVVEVDAPANRQAGRAGRVPDAVIDGLAERLLVTSAVDLEPEFERAFSASSDEQEKKANKQLWEELKRRASERTESVLGLAVPAELQREATGAIRERIHSQRARAIVPNGADGKRLTAAKESAAEGRLAALRRASGTDEWLMLADLTPAEVNALRKDWQPGWGKANRPWGEMDDLPLWRCSSAVLGLGRREYEGKSIEEARRASR